MKNAEIAKILLEIGEYLEMEGVIFKPRAYQKAGEIIQDILESLEEVYKKGGVKALGEISGVGVSMAEIIEELIKTGQSKYYNELRKKIPVNLNELTSVEGLGPKNIKKLYDKLGIKNLKELEKMAKDGKIRELEGFGRKSEEKILKGIDFLKRSGGRFVLGFVMPQIQDIKDRLTNLKEVEIVEIAGSARRKKETIGDVDILIVSENSKPIMDYFIKMPEVIDVISHGETKSAVRLKNGLDMDLRVLPKESYGAGLSYFTGSKDHNVALRELAIKKGYKLNEYGLWKGDKQIAGRREEDLYKVLGLKYIVPELRENTGEIEASLREAENKLPGLPKLVGYDDLRGDLQVQSNWTDGSNSIEEMAEEAIRRGLEYIAITDHTKRLTMTHGLNEKRILEQIREINRLNKKLKGKIKILSGSECDILKDGSLDLDDKTLAQLDVVGVSVHSYFNLSYEDQTERVIRAIRNPNVDILFHPTGRIINKRDAYEIDMGKIIEVAKVTRTVLEIDSYPDRMDLKDEYIRTAVQAGVKLSIDSDAHSLGHFSYLEFGIGNARRGWATKGGIVNTHSWEEMLKLLK